MSILGRYTNNLEKRRNDSLKVPHEYEMPAVTREINDGSISLKKGMIISVILHPATILTILIVMFILTLLGVDFSKWNKPKTKVNDIEFVLVDREETPLNKNTKYRADKNSRTGGINNPKLPVSMPASSTPSAKPAAASSPAPSQPKKSLVNKITQAVAPKVQPSKKPAQTTTQKNVAPSPTVSKAVPKQQAAKPAPPSARPSVKPPMTPRPALKPSGSPFKVPVPSGGTTAGQYATGPISGSGSSSKGGTSGSGHYSPNPSFAPIGSGSGTRTASKGTGTGSSGTGRGTGSGGRGTGNGGGNPGGGGGRPGIDAIREPDFGPYMRELQRRIKMSWDPPKGNESKRVVLLFTIAKDGRLLSCRVLKSSGAPNADKAALNAVHLAAPFKPLPPEYKNSSVDIQFTFDYNVFSATKY